MIKPMADQVVVKLPPTQEKVGSLWVPLRAQDVPHEGTVLATGPRCSSDVFVGARVMFQAYAGLDVEDEDHGEVVMMDEGSILAVLEA